MSLFSKEHYELLAMFEREFKHRRLDKEPKELWPKGVVFQDGHVNELFVAYRSGAAFASAIALQAEQAVPGFVMPTDRQIAMAMLSVDDPLAWGKLGAESGKAMIKQFVDALLAPIAARPSEPPKAPVEPVGEREPWPTPPPGDHLRLQDFTPGQIEAAAVKVADKLSSDEKREILNDCGFVTGPNYVRTTGVLYRSLGTQTNVWERDLFALIDAARSTKGSK